MDPRRLELLLELSRLGSMREVSESMHVTTSTVSQQIAALAQEAGTPLTEAHGRQVRLTPAGQRLAGHAVTILAAIEAARLDLDPTATPAGTVRVAAFATAVRESVLPVVRLLAQRHPAVLLAIHEHEPDEALGLLADDAVDLALTYDYNLAPARFDRSLVTQPLGQRQWALGTPTTQGRVAGTALEVFRRFADHDWIVNSRNSGDEEVIRTVASLAGFQPRITHRVDSLELVQDMILAGLGVGLLPAGRPVRRGVVLRPLGRPDVTQRPFAVTRRGRSAWPPLALVLQLLGEISGLTTRRVNDELRVSPARRGSAPSFSSGAVATARSHAVCFAPVSEGQRTIMSWPSLPLEQWQPTRDTVHRWTQIVGKTRLGLEPRSNHWWNSSLYVTARGLTTSLMPYSGSGVEVEFDFTRHELTITTTRGETRRMALAPRSVADFYAEYRSHLDDLGIEVTINTMPCEVDDATGFESDTEHDAYDPEAIHRFWLSLVSADRVLGRFRAGFRGKASPVHFFWGAFDLAVTRFSGRPAPRHPGGIPHCPDWVMEEAYSDEVSSAGYWPGGADEGVFYSYAYPAPDGFASHPVVPNAAYYDERLGEFVLPYAEVRKAADPDTYLTEFLDSTFRAARDLAGWPDRP